MTRIWQQLTGNAQGRRPSAPPAPPAELLTPDIEPYVVRPARPMTQLAARVGLWAAVGFGCLGGLLGLFQPASGDTPPVVADGDDDEALVPAPVAGLAELVVREWLPATDDDQDRLNELFAEPPSVTELDAENLSVVDATTVAGRRLEEAYWTVTVAAVVVETVNGETQPAGTWYVEVPIVGDVSGGLVALTTPAVLPGPPAAAEGWAVAGPSPAPPDDDEDPVATTVEGFLNALLAGDGDPSRYVAPRVSVRAADPAPFTEVEVMEIAIEERDDGAIRVRVIVRATTEEGSHKSLSYEMVAAQRVDRWEIVEFPAIPIAQLPSAEDSSGEPAAPSDEPQESSDSTDEDGHAHDHSESDGQSPEVEGSVEPGSSEAVESSTTTAGTAAQPGA